MSKHGNKILTGAREALRFSRGDGSAGRLTRLVVKQLHDGAFAVKHPIHGNVTRLFRKTQGRGGNR